MIIVPEINAELLHLFQSLQKCLKLRDKYICKSRQRLGDNPRDYDGHFSGLDDDHADVSGMRPDTSFASNHSPAQPEKWRIYPKPPPPHWHWTDKRQAVTTDGRHSPVGEFNFDECEIPGEDPWEFAIDDTGVYQVYDNAEHQNPIFDIPTVREYFQDLDYVLGVIADGPTKSFAFRRLRYLSSKFQMYNLMNEVQEMAEMKRVPHR
jgi:AMP deaminase